MRKRPVRQKSEIELRALYQQRAQEKGIQKPLADSISQQAKERRERAKIRAEKHDLDQAKLARDRRARTRAAKYEALLKEACQALTLLTKAEAARARTKKQAEFTGRSGLKNNSKEEQLVDQGLVMVIDSRNISFDQTSENPDVARGKNYLRRNFPHM